MDDLRDLFINLIAALLASLLGFGIGLSRTIIKRYRMRWERKFWRNLLNGPLLATLGTHNRRALLNWEPSGLIGVGDVEALRGIQRTVALLDGPPFEVVYGIDAMTQNLRDNLVLIGGPDGNAVTREILRRVSTGLRFREGARATVGLTDIATSEVYTPERARGTLLQKGKVVRDFGIIIFAKNPFYSDSNILIIAGSYGYASVAGVRLLGKSSFLKHSRVRSGEPFECMFVTDIFGEVASQPTDRQWKIRPAPPAPPTWEEAEPPRTVAAWFKDRLGGRARNRGT